MLRSTTAKKKRQESRRQYLADIRERMQNTYSSLCRASMHNNIIYNVFHKRLHGRDIINSPALFRPQTWADSERNYHCTRSKGHPASKRMEVKAFVCARYGIKLCIFMWSLASSKGRENDNIENGRDCILLDLSYAKLTKAGTYSL